MIVRLMGGDGQYRVDDGLVAELNAIDDRATAAMEAGDEIALNRALSEMAMLVRSRGERLADDDLSTSDLVVPPSDLSVAETRALMTHEGFIPDLPS